MTVGASPSAAKKQHSPFWRFSLQIYRSISDTCLELQDRFGVDVNMLLFLLFAAHNGRRVGTVEVQTITSAIESWNRSVVVPLRSVRRVLRSPPAIIEQDGAAKLRENVKQIELEAERLQQEALYEFMPIERLGSPDAVREAAARSNIEAYAAELGTAFEPPLTEALLEGFRKVGRPAEDRHGVGR